MRRLNGIYTHLSQDIYLGDDTLIERTQARMLEVHRKDTEIPRAQRVRKRAALAESFTETNDIASGVMAAYRSGRFTMRQIADHLGVHYSTISRLLARLEVLDRKT